MPRVSRVPRIIDPSEAESLTKELIGIPSVTLTRSGAGRGGPGTEPARWNEAKLAEWIGAWFGERGISCELEEIPDGRKNVFAFLPGASPKTVVLMGHIDTVPPSPGQVAGPAGGRDDGHLFGRGALDMKSGIAVAMKLMESWKGGPDPLPVSVLFLATCDEEVESRGVLAALQLLREVKGGTSARASRLTGGGPRELLGVVNVDYTTERFPGDPDVHAWNGTIGKLLAGVYVRGYQTHAGEYFRGFHAIGLLSRLIAAIDGNAGLTGGAPPPVTLKVSDAKEEYNVMTSPAGWAYFNIFSTGDTPSRTMGNLKTLADRVIGEYLADLNRSYEAYSAAANLPGGGLMWETSVTTYAEVFAASVARAGKEKVEAMKREVFSSEEAGDVREKSFRLLERLLSLLEDRDPLVVLMFLPPFYPYVAPDRGLLSTSLDAAVRTTGVRQEGKGTGPATPDVTVTVEEFYPYISDMSYLRVGPEIRKTVGELISQMPAWGMGYELDFDAIAGVDLPVINVGPYGFGAHQAEERVERTFTFGTLPRLLDAIVRGLK